MSNLRVYRERLIEEVKKYPVLYDTRHVNHRDIDVRDRSWTEIAEKLGINSEVLKREWKILRDSLRQAVKKTRGLATTKAGAPCKKWRFQSHMAFLIPYMTLRPQRTSLREDFKPIIETEQHESSEPAPARAGVEWSIPGTGTEDDSALELFFASVCASARRLPPALQRELKRGVLDTLLTLEARAASASAAPSTADLKPAQSF